MITSHLNLDEFTKAYIACALWSSNDESDERGGYPLDKNYSADDIAPEALASMIEDCAAFQRDHAADIDGDDIQAGHDFWLTRNRHGAGFWDGGWRADVGRRLTDAAHVYGSVDLYVGDDGKIHSN